MPVLEHNQFVSSNVKSFSYDTDSRELRVFFTNGSAYSYSNVPHPLYESFVSSPSKGKFLASIKRSFPVRKI